MPSGPPSLVCSARRSYSPRGSGAGEALAGPNPPPTRPLPRRRVDGRGATVAALASRAEHRETGGLQMPARIGREYLDVLVPYERCFVLAEPELCNGISTETSAAAHMTHQVVTRTTAKTEYLLGLVSLSTGCVCSGSPGTPACPPSPAGRRCTSTSSSATRCAWQGRSSRATTASRTSSGCATSCGASRGRPARRTGRGVVRATDGVHTCGHTQGEQQERAERHSEREAEGAGRTTGAVRDLHQLSPGGHAVAGEAPVRDARRPLRPRARLPRRRLARPRGEVARGDPQARRGRGRLPRPHRPALAGAAARALAPAGGRGRGGRRQARTRGRAAARLRPRGAAGARRRRAHAGRVEAARPTQAARAQA